MLKMLKYEYRRAIFPLSIVFMIFGVLEVYFLAATALEKEEHSVIAAMLLFFLSGTCYLFVLVYGVACYSNDLKNKQGFLVFMTPISSYKVIGAKLLSTLVTGITLVVTIFVFGAIDYSYAAKTYHFDGFIDFLEDMLNAFGHDMKSSIFALLAFVVVVLIQFFMTTTIAYLAVSLSATVLQNKKGKTFLSIIFFIVLYAIANSIATGIMTGMNIEGSYEYFADAVVNMIPVIIVYTITMILCFVGSGALLEKKISL